ncbi:unnamed protein product, partial [Laminaria digitata]
VREKAQELADLIGNPDRVRAERLKARDLKAQYSGYGAHMSPRPSTGSSRDISSPRDDAHGDSAGSGGRYSGEISDDWRAGYDRSPTPPDLDWQRAIGGNGGGAISDKIDFDAGREGYSGRLSQYQEKERREASQAGSSRSRRFPADATPTSGGQNQPKGGRGSGASKKRDERRPSAAKDKISSGPDLLSGADPFPASAPRASNDFSSFAAFEPQPLQGGAPVVGGWYGGGAGGGPPQQWAPTEAAGQMVPYGQSAPGIQNQQQQPQQQQQQSQQFQGQPVWSPQGPKGLQAGQQQPPQASGYGQNTGQGQALGYGGQFGGQRQQNAQGWPQQQQQQQQQQQPNEQQVVPRQHGQPQQQQSYQQYQAYQQQQQQQQKPYPPQQPQQQLYPPQQQQQQQQQQPVQQHVQQQLAHQHQQQPQQQQQQPQQQQQQLHQQQPQQQQQQREQQQQQQLSPAPPAPPEPQQPPAQTQQSPPLQAQQPPPPQSQAAHQQQASGSGNSQHGVTVDGDWVPTEVVRAGIAGRDLAAAVADLRQTGFKPSDVGGQSVFSGQGRRGSGAGPSAVATMAAPGSAQRPAAHQKPPQNVEYVEEGQELKLRAGTSEFLGARSGLNRTGLSGRLQQQPQQQQQQPPPPPQQQQQQHHQPSPPPPQHHQQQVSAASPLASPMASPGVVAGAVGQWQGLPRAHQGSGGGRGGGGGGGAGQQPSWQTGLRSTGLAESSGSGGAPNVTASAGHAAGSAQQQGGAQGGAAAPWQQGAAGLRRTGL